MEQEHTAQNNITTSAYPYLLAVFCSIIILGNIYALKITRFFSILTPSGMICFPFTFSICDIITEVYGEKAADRAIKMGLIILVIYFISLNIVTMLEPAPGWDNQHAWETIFSSSPRIILGTFLAYYLGEKINSKILSMLKSIFNGKFFLRRSIASTIIGVTVDTFVFNFIAFFGKFSLNYWLIFTCNQLVLKVFFELFGSWVSSIIVPILAKKENLSPIQPKTWINKYWQTKSK